MKIESKNMAMGTQSLQQMARDYQWWDPQWEIALKRGGYLSESYQEVH